ncbi:DUF885 domain-containing protein [uncultured Abyssibacter sp.]|uniref:DUF885 domain-containing protein n=1 Tax=uncultured Abyssibacter sp. TaxID=2320202 RepID=UPI0032B2CC69
MRIIIVSMLAALLAACGQSSTEPAEQAAAKAEPGQTETDRINAWFEEKFEEELQYSPIQMTFLGRKDRYGELGDFSEAGARKQLDWRKAATEEMTSTFDYDALSDEAKMSYDIWAYETQQAEAGWKYRYNGYPFNQMQGMHTFLPTFLISFHKVDDAADMEAYISRVNELPAAFGELIKFAKASAEKGIRPPKFAHEAVIKESKKLIAGAPFDDGEDSSIWADMQSEIDTLAEKGEVDEEQAKQLKADAEKALLESFKPAYDAVIAWVESDLPNAGENPSGVGSTQPNGEEFYKYRLWTQTTTDMTADEIHQIGLDEVERLRGEMIALKERVEFDGDLDAFFEFLNEDSQFRFPNTDEGRQMYIAEATAAIDNIKQHLPDYFGRLPKADLVVKRVEPFREQDGAAQHYFPGTPDGSRPGTYYAHLSDMDAMPIPELEVIAYHEGIPGHHMQISIAQELKDVPMFRTQTGFTAYVEGWALYSEWLAKEMPGTYENPYSEFGQLSSEIWRAIRLVVDTGMHAKGWTEEQAVEYFDNNSPVPLTSIKSEIQRYLVIPGQATSYKIGMLKIQELRREAEAELGDAFDIKGFHDTVLGGGALPLELLERRVNMWIESQKAAAAG